MAFQNIQDPYMRQGFSALAKAFAPQNASSRIDADLKGRRAGLVTAQTGTEKQELIDLERAAASLQAAQDAVLSGDMSEEAARRALAAALLGTENGLQYGPGAAVGMSSFINPGFMNPDDFSNVLLGAGVVAGEGNTPRGHAADIVAQGERNDADNATSILNNNADNATSVANNNADNATSVANNNADNATSVANNNADNATSVANNNADNDTLTLNNDADNAAAADRNAADNARAERIAQAQRLAAEVEAALGRVFTGEQNDLDRQNAAGMNDADNATSVANNDADNATSVANNDADNATSVANNDADNATSVANNEADNQNEMAMALAGLGSGNKPDDISTADLKALQEQLTNRLMGLGEGDAKADAIDPQIIAQAMPHLTRAFRVRRGNHAAAVEDVLKLINAEYTNGWLSRPKISGTVAPYVPDAPPVADAPRVAEGAKAVNPETGEVIIMKGGTWVPVEP